MSQEIAVRQNIAPTPQTREFRDLLGLYGNKIETTPAGTSLTSDRPTGSDLARIEKRRAELVVAKQPTDPKQIVPRIGRLFLRFPSARIEDPEATTAVYAIDLAPFPLWAIEAGIMALLRGHGLDNRSFAPSSVVVRDAVVREMARVDAELAMINRVLDARPKLPPPPNADRKARALAEAMDFVSGSQNLSAASRRGRMTTDEIADAKAVSEMLATGQADPRPMPPLSPYLRGKLGLTGKAYSVANDPVSGMVPDLQASEDAA